MPNSNYATKQSQSDSNTFTSMGPRSVTTRVGPKELIYITDDDKRSTILNTPEVKEPQGLLEHGSVSIEMNIMDH